MKRNLRLRSLTTVAAGVVSIVMMHGSIGDGQEVADAMKEEKRLSGLWRVDVFEWDGQRNTAKEFKDKSSDVFEWRWLFTAGKAEWVVSPEFKFEYLRYKLSLRTMPKTIDIEVNGSTLKGIYLVDDGTLKACFSVQSAGGKKLVPGKEDRPTDFTTKEKSERLLIIFVKV